MFFYLPVRIVENYKQMEPQERYVAIQTQQNVSMIYTNM